MACTDHTYVATEKKTKYFRTTAESFSSGNCNVSEKNDCERHCRLIPVNTQFTDANSLLVNKRKQLSLAKELLYTRNHDSKM